MDFVCFEEGGTGEEAIRFGQWEGVLVGGYGSLRYEVDRQSGLLITLLGVSSLLGPGSKMTRVRLRRRRL